MAAVGLAKLTGTHYRAARTGTVQKRKTTEMKKNKDTTRDIAPVSMLAAVAS